MTTDKPNAALAVDRPHAQIVYFETAPVCAHVNGLIAVTLGAGLQSPEGDGTLVHTDQVIVAYLRTNIVGARLLRDMIDKALLLAEPAESAAKN